MTEDELNKLKEELLTRKQAASLLQKSEHTLLNWGKQNKIKEHWLNGFCYYYKSEIFNQMK